MPLRLERLPRDAGEFRALLPAGSPRGLDLTLAGPLVLARTHEMPTKGRAQASRVLALQLKLLSPKGEDDFLAGHRRTITRDGRDSYVQLVVRRRDVGEVVRLAREEGLEVRRVQAEAGGLRVEILDRRALADRDLRTWWALGGLGALALLVVATLQAERAAQAARVAVEVAGAHLAGLQAEADQAIQGRDAAALLNAALLADAAHLAQDADALVRLADLTAALPASAWLTSLVAEPGLVTVAGTSSGEASDLVGLLDALPWVAGVELGQPFQRDPVGGTTAFELLLVTEATAP